MKDLTPRDGANIPNREKLSPAEKKVMEEVERLTKSESAAFAVFAQAQQGTQFAVEDCADRLQAIMDMMVKIALHFSIPLPAAIARDMEAKVYDPDDVSEGDDEEDEDDDGVPDGDADERN